MRVLYRQVWKAFMAQFGRLRQKDGTTDLPPEALTQATFPTSVNGIAGSASAV